MSNILTTENIGLTSISLLIIGFVKIILYYKYFNVPIIEYIKPSEVTTLFSDNIATAFAICLYLSWPYTLIVRPYISNNSRASISILEILHSYITLGSTFLATTAISTILVIVFLFFRPKINNYELASYLVVVPIISLVIPTLAIFASINGKTNDSQYVIMFSLIASFTIIIFLSTINEIIKVKYYKYYCNTIIELENETLESNSTYYYVGKTKSFIFFYSSIEKSSTAFSSLKLKSIKYKPSN